MLSPIRSDHANTSTPTLSRSRGSVKTKPSVAVEKKVKEPIFSPNRTSEMSVMKQINKDPIPSPGKSPIPSSSKVPIPSPARSVKIPAVNPILSIPPSTPDPTKPPRFQFLWRGMKKADAVLQPETKPTRKIPFLKLGQLASGHDKLDADSTHSDIEVDDSAKGT